jgi:hypothetical protein
VFGQFSVLQFYVYEIPKSRRFTARIPSSSTQPAPQKKSVLKVAKNDADPGTLGRHILVPPRTIKIVYEIAMQIFLHWHAKKETCVCTDI